MIGARTASGGPLFITVGDNPARAFGMSAEDRARALAAKAGLQSAEAAEPGRATLYADLDWAWDPEWVAALAKTPGEMLTKDGHPILVHVPADGDPARVHGGADRPRGTDVPLGRQLTRLIPTDRTDRLAA